MMRPDTHFPSSSFTSASRWLREPAAATVVVASVILAVEEACEQGGAFVGGPFFTDRGIGVLVLHPDGTVIEYLQSDEADCVETAREVGQSKEEKRDAEENVRRQDVFSKSA